MGLLTIGTPLEWNEAKPHLKHVKTHGIIQFLNIYNKVKTRRLDHLLWGEEVEYCVVKLNTIEKTATLSLKAEETLHKLEDLEHSAIKSG
jgi:glutamate--cysteine ligase catalytic subunit